MYGIWLEAFRNNSVSNILSILIVHFLNVRTKTILEDDIVVDAIRTALLFHLRKFQSIYHVVDVTQRQTILKACKQTLDEKRK